MNIARTEKARSFAHAAHDSIDHRRKYTKEPYWVHTDEVAQIVREAGGTDNMICAAHLHDVVEDVTPINPLYSLASIEKEFGTVVAGLVQELTDVYTKSAYPEKNREERHSLERVRQAKISSDSATVKLCDILSNSKNIMDYDADFAVTYLEEIRELLPLLKHGNPFLWQAAQEQLQRFSPIVTGYANDPSQKLPLNAVREA